MQKLNIEIFECPDDAPNYRRDHPEIKSAILLQANIVKNGTTEGKPTVDLVFMDKQGNQYMTMCTARLLNSVQAIVEGIGTA